MLMASIIAHISLGALFSLFFVLYYINGSGKWKIYLELLLGSGNIAGIFVLYRTFGIDDTEINLFSIAACLFSFLIITFILIIILSFIIKDKEGKDLIRLRDIIFGQASWIKEFRDKRQKEIDEKLNYDFLKKKEAEIKEMEKSIEIQKEYIEGERNKIEDLGKKNLKIRLPIKSDVILTKDYIELMPSYFKDVINCINEINDFENKYLYSDDKFDYKALRAYLIAISLSISSNIFNCNSTDIRIHFRYYNIEKDGYDKLVAINGKKIVSQNMTLIPYQTDNMIAKSYECKRALIKSINCDYDYKSNNSAVWKDYLTYTFYNVEIGNKPYLSFGISVKNDIRYKKIFYFLNYINFEDHLQEKIENLHINFNLKNIIYGG